MVLLLMDSGLIILFFFFSNVLQITLHRFCSKSMLVSVSVINNCVLFDFSDWHLDLLFLAQVKVTCLILAKQSRK